MTKIGKTILGNKRIEDLGTEVEEMKMDELRLVVDGSALSNDNSKEHGFSQIRGLCTML